MPPPKLILILLAGAVMAQGGRAEGREKEPAARQVRFLAVGDLPPFRQEVRDGVRYELEPPPGSIPPRELVLAEEAESGEEAGVGQIRLQLGRLSPGLKLRGGAGNLLLRAAGSDGETEPWLRVERPEGGDFLVVMWRDPVAGTWAKAKSFVVSGSPAAGKAWFLNVASGPVALMFDQERVALPVGRTLERNLEPGRPVSFQLGLPGGSGEIRRFASTSLEQQKGEGSLVVVYRSDGVSPRQALGVKVIREEAADILPGAGL